MYYAEYTDILGGSGTLLTRFGDRHGPSHEKIITMDEEHMKYVVSTGFDQFWRGRRQRERMYVWPLSTPARR